MEKWIDKCYDGKKVVPGIEMKDMLLEYICNLEKEITRISYLIDVQGYIRMCRITDQLRSVAGRLS